MSVAMQSRRRPVSKVHHALSNERGKPLGVSSFGLQPDTGYFWRFGDAPQQIQDMAMCMERPEIVKVVPHHLRFHFVTDDAVEVYTLADAIICFE